MSKLTKIIIFVKIPSLKGEGRQFDTVSGLYFERMLHNMSDIAGKKTVCLLTPTDIDMSDSIDKIYDLINDEVDIRSSDTINEQYICIGKYQKIVKEIRKYIDFCEILIVFVHEELSVNLPYYFSLDYLNVPLRTLPVQDYGYYIINIDMFTVTTVDNMTADSFVNEEK